MTLFVLFSQYLGILRLRNTVKQWKTKNDKSTLFYPPTGVKALLSHDILEKKGHRARYT